MRHTTRPEIKALHEAEQNLLNTRKEAHHDRRLDLLPGLNAALDTIRKTAKTYK